MVRALSLAALLAAWPIAGAAQAPSTETVDGYPVQAMRDYWNVARDIQDDYRFDFAHGDAVDAVEDSRFVLSVDRADEEGSQSRTWLVAHCKGEIPDGGRSRNCRYRVVVSTLSAVETEVEFDAAGAADRLREAGVLPEAFLSLVRDVPLSMGRPTNLPPQWGEARRVQLIIAAPIITDFATRHKVSSFDSATCASMAAPLKTLDGLTFSPLRITGMSNEPKWRASLPHSPIYEFKVLSGTTTLRWGEGSITTPIGNRILSSLRAIDDDCPETSVDLSSGAK